MGIVSVIAGGAAAIGGTIALLSARSTFDDASKAGCPGADATMCNQKASSVQAANTASKILFIGAGVLGAAGTVMIIAAPSPTPGGRVGWAVRGRF